MMRSIGVWPLHHSVPGDNLAVERGAQLWRATLRGVVHVVEAESVRVTVGPLEVVHQAPEEVALHGHAVGHGALELTEIIEQVHDAVGVVYLAVRSWDIRRRGAILGD